LDRFRSFDVVAKVPDGTTMATANLMLQNLTPGCQPVQQQGGPVDPTNPASITNTL
jgi:hypothetical protein